jgi:hypothetical protein
MNERSDMDRVLTQWFEDGPSTMPDRVVDVVADRIARQRQRPAWRLHWRAYDMNSSIKIAAAIAAVVVLAVVGWNVLPGRSTGVGVGPAPTPTPTPSPTSSPSASAVFPQWFTSGSESSGAGILLPGSQTTRAFLPGSTFSVPEGWVSDTDSADFYGLFPDTPANEAEFALSGGRAQGIFMGLVGTPDGLICDGVGVTNGSTAAELAQSLVANEALVTSEPVDVAIGGLTGTRVDAHIDPDWTGSCPRAPEDPPTKDYKDYRGRFVFLDIPRGGKLLIIVDSVHAADFEAFLAEAMPVVESFQFNLGPEASPS